MQQKIREIASRVRELRELSGLSAQQMAEKLDVPPHSYQDYENGKGDIPASILYKIAVELQVDMGLLLTGEMPRMHIFCVTRKDQGVEVERRRQYGYRNLAANFIHKKAEPFLVTVDPGPASRPPQKNAHLGQEFNFVLEGRLRILIHNHEIELEAGDSIYFDAGYEHAMQALDDRPAKFLAIIL